MYTSECMDKFWYIPIMEYYSAIEMNKLWIHATALINRKIIMLSERKNIIKSAYSMIPSM